MNAVCCYDIIKRALDFIFALIAIIILLPLGLIIAVLIMVENKGAAIFKQTRAGKDAKPFVFYKFRSMRADADPFGSSPNSNEDPRITRIGRVLRETSLDELPQLWNILNGDMSLVGPRPLYISQIDEWTSSQKRRLEVKPGLTGLAQISGRGSLTIEQKLDLDVEYVNNRSFLLDCKIVFVTFMQVVCRKGIYEVRYSKKQKVRGGQ